MNKAKYNKIIWLGIVALLLLLLVVMCYSCGPELANHLRFRETAFTYTVRILPAVIADVRPFDEMRVDY